MSYIEYSIMCWFASKRLVHHYEHKSNISWVHNRVNELTDQYGRYYI